MTSITIGPTGKDFTQPDSAAYAALVGGGPHTVTWTGGAVYRPTAGRWWGIDRRRGVPKRINHVVDGYTGSLTTRAMADARVYFSPSGTDGTYVGDGVWLIEVVTAGIPAVPVTELYVGAVASNTVAGLSLGQRYRKADSLVKCNSSGAALAGMLTGNGIWWAQQGSPTTTLQLYIWCPLGNAQYPAAQWGGIAITYSTNGVGSSGSPNYSPWMFERDVTYDPTGSTVGAGFSSIGSILHDIGAVSEAASVAGLPWGTVTYTDFVGYGAGGLARIGSSAAGTTVTSVNGDTFFYDDLADPYYNPENPGDQQGESISLNARAKTCVWQNGTMNLGRAHAALNIGAAATVVAEERITSPRMSNIAVRFKAGTRDARGISISNSDDAVIDWNLFEGCTTQGHWGGVSTLLHSNTWRLGQPAQNDVTESYASVDARADLDGDPTAVRVKAYRNVIDRRGDAARGATARSCIKVRSGPSGAFPAGGLDARDNVLLGDSGTCALWVSEKTTAVDRNQRFTGTQHNMAVEARVTTDPGTALGADTTFASALNTGTTTGSQYISSGEILSRGDRHANLYGAVSPPM